MANRIWKTLALAYGVTQAGMKSMWPARGEKPASAGQKNHVSSMAAWRVSNQQ